MSEKTTFEQIKEIAELMKTQDNQCTSNPIYLVQQKIREYGMDGNYCDEYEWINCADDWLPVEDEELILKLDDAEFADKLDKDFPDYTKQYYRDRWEFITLFFTEKAAREWIEGAKYRYDEGSLRVYVDSAYRNHHLQLVQKFIEEQI